MAKTAAWTLGVTRQARCFIRFQLYYNVSREPLYAIRSFPPSLDLFPYSNGCAGRMSILNLPVSLPLELTPDLAQILSTPHKEV